MPLRAGIVGAQSVSLFCAFRGRAVFEHMG
jgi:hypothetical protein